MLKNFFLVEENRFRIKIGLKISGEARGMVFGGLSHLTKKSKQGKNLLNYFFKKTDYVSVFNMQNFFITRKKASKLFEFLQKEFNQHA